MTNYPDFLVKRICWKYTAPYVSRCALYPTRVADVDQVSSQSNHMCNDVYVYSYVIVCKIVFEPHLIDIGARLLWWEDTRNFWKCWSFEDMIQEISVDLRHGSWEVNRSCLAFPFLHGASRWLCSDDIRLYLL